MQQPHDQAHEALLSLQAETYQSHERMMFKFMEWLLPTTVGDRLSKGDAQSRSFRCQRWDDFWILFKKDGSMSWETFENYLRNHGTLSVNARKLFELLDDTSEGKISARAVLEVRRQYEKSIDVRHSGLADLKKILVRAYRSLMRAWWLLFDEEQTGRCCKTVFMKRCKQVGFHGDVKQVWFDITGGEIHRAIFPEDLDPEGDKIMLSVVTALKKYYGSVRDSWFAIMRAHGSYGCMHEEQFRTVCEDLGFHNGEGKKVFSWVDLDISAGIQLEEWMMFGLWEHRVKEEPRSAGQDDANFGLNSLGRNRPSVTAALPAWTMATLKPPSSGGLGSPNKLDGSHGSNEGEPTYEFVVTLTREEHDELLRRRAIAKGRSGEGLHMNLALHQSFGR